MEFPGTRQTQLGPSSLSRLGLFMVVVACATAHIATRAAEGETKVLHLRNGYGLEVPATWTEFTDTDRALLKRLKLIFGANATGEGPVGAATYRLDGSWSAAALVSFHGRETLTQEHVRQLGPNEVEDLGRRYRDLPKELGWADPEPFLEVLKVQKRSIDGLLALVTTYKFRNVDGGRFQCLAFQVFDGPRSFSLNLAAVEDAPPEVLTALDSIAASLRSPVSVEVPTVASTLEVRLSNSYTFDAPSDWVVAKSGRAISLARYLEEHKRAPIGDDPFVVNHYRPDGRLLASAVINFHPDKLETQAFVNALGPKEVQYLSSSSKAVVEKEFLAAGLRLLEWKGLSKVRVGALETLVTTYKVDMPRAGPFLNRAVGVSDGARSFTLTLGHAADAPEDVRTKLDYLLMSVRRRP